MMSAVAPFSRLRRALSTYAPELTHAAVYAAGKHSCPSHGGEPLLWGRAVEKAGPSSTFRARTLDLGYTIFFFESP